MKAWVSLKSNAAVIMVEEKGCMELYTVTALIGFALGGFSKGFGAPAGMTVVGAGVGFSLGYIYTEYIEESPNQD